MHGDLCVDEDDQFLDVALPEVFTQASLDDDEEAAHQAAAELDSIYTRITWLWNELEAIERALRLCEHASQRARHTRAWVREALGGLEYPVFRGLDEAQMVLWRAAQDAPPPPEAANKPYLFRMPSALRLSRPYPDKHGDTEHA